MPVPCNPAAPARCLPGFGSESEQFSSSSRKLKIEQIKKTKANEIIGMDDNSNHQGRSEMFRDALAYATEMHKGQVRNDAQSTPYVQHPIRVAQRCKFCFLGCAIDRRRC